MSQDAEATQGPARRAAAWPKWPANCFFAELGGEATVSVEDAKLLSVVRGVLEPLDMLIAHAQSDVGGGVRAHVHCKAVGDVIKETGPTPLRCPC